MGDKLEYEQHELSAWYPPLPDDQFTALAADIVSQGLLDDITLLDGKILDGWHRYRACVLKGIEPRFIEYIGDDPVAYVASKNTLRRHLDKTQLAFIGAKIKTYYEEAAKERKLAGNVKGGKGKSMETLPSTSKSTARDDAAKALGGAVSGRTIDSADAIMKKGTPELVEAVKTHKLTVHEGGKVANLSAARQKKAVAASKEKLKKGIERVGRIARGEEDDKGKPFTGKPSLDQINGTPLVRLMLVQLDRIARDMTAKKVTAPEYAKRFDREFKWDDSILVKQLAGVRRAVQAISLIDMEGRVRTMTPKKPKKKTV